MLILLLNVYFLTFISSNFAEWIIGQKKIPIENSIQFKIKTKQLLSKLQEDITKDWIYEDLFYKPLHIGVTPELVQKSFSNLGDETRLQLLFIKALRGHRVTLPVIGGSISRGATFAEEHQGNRIFFPQVAFYPKTPHLSGLGPEPGT